MGATTLKLAPPLSGFSVGMPSFLGQCVSPLMLWSMMPAWGSPFSKLVLGVWGVQILDSSNVYGGLISSFLLILTLWRCGM